VVFTFPSINSIVNLRLFMASPITRWKTAVNHALAPITAFLVDIGHLLKKLFVLVLVICISAFAAWWLLPNDWRIKYAAEYMLDTDKVVIEHKPHNCEWGSAPIGNKHCHYKPIVTFYDSVGAVIRTEDVTPTKVNVEWERIEE